MYYTNEHEWIEYNGYTALVGICKIKLSGTHGVQRISHCPVLANMEKGGVIATLHSGRYCFDIYMPVDGRVVDFNKKLIENPTMLLSSVPESIWIVKISPSAPYKRDGLLQEHQYLKLNKKGYGAI